MRLQQTDVSRAMRSCGLAVLLFSLAPIVGSSQGEPSAPTGFVEAAERAGDLHAMSAHLLPPPRAAAHRSDDVRKLKAALRALAAEVVAAGRDASRLADLEQRRRSARDSFEAFRERLRASGNGELANELETRMSALWSDLDAALASSSGRTEKLEDSKAEVSAALGNSRPHGVSYTVIPVQPRR
jgi:hypothetical protein